jgi:serine phosphatase RsbU (regulator of sigma subunit)/Tfp pilus assembly protein PilF
MKVSIILFWLLMFKVVIAQGTNDSLIIVAKIDSARTLFTIDPKLAIKISKVALKDAITINSKYLESYCLNTVGSSFYYEGIIDSSIAYHNKALKIQLVNNFKVGVGRSYTNLGICFIEKMKYEEAISSFIKAEPYFVAEKYNVGLSKLYNSLGVLFYELDQLSKSEIYYLKALKIATSEKDNTTLYNVYSNLANIYSDLRNSDKSIEYYLRALDIAKKESINSDIVFILNNLSTEFIKSQKFDSAFRYNSMALDLIKANSLDYHFKKNSYGNYAELLNFKKDYTKAIVYIDSAILFADQDEDLNKIYQLQIIKEKILFNFGKYDLAHELMVKNRFLLDSINDNNMQSKTNELEAKYETEKKELQIKSQTFEIETKEKQNKQKSFIILFGTLALVGTGFFAAIAFINFKKTKKQNLIIENQKMEVELKNEEITHQKELVDEKQKEIIDSINYAKRIQQAVLTGEDVWNKISKEYFILFKPKDIVSGDFYWAYNTPNNRSIFCLADCTGHGVPGGFMSMLGNSFLNEIVVENKIFKADQILNKLRSKIIHALEQKGGTQQKDGMDMSLCVWNKLDNTLEFAGANNPLWLVRKNENAVTELVEVKADKMPIGLYLETETPFSSVTIQLQAGDIIYLCTDGYADQFGGPKGKKLKYKPLIESLIKNSALPMSEQKMILDTTFNDWMHKHDQVDDVSLIGVKVV